MKNKLMAICLILVIALVGCGTKKETTEPSIQIDGTASIKIGNITYFNSDYEVSAVPQERSVVSLHELVNDKEDVITAYAVIEDEKVVYCCIDGKWYRFLAGGINRVQYLRSVR